MAKFTTVAADDEKMLSYALSPVPVPLQREIDAFILHRTATFAARRAGGAVVSVSAEGDKQARACSLPLSPTPSVTLSRIPSRAGSPPLLWLPLQPRPHPRRSLPGHVPPWPPRPRRPGAGVRVLAADDAGAALLHHRQLPQRPDQRHHLRLRQPGPARGDAAARADAADAADQPPRPGGVAVQDAEPLRQARRWLDRLAICAEGARQGGGHRLQARGRNGGEAVQAARLRRRLPPLPHPSRPRRPHPVRNARALLPLHTWRTSQSV